jgi:hypothetical protein
LPGRFVQRAGFRKSARLRDENEGSALVRKSYAPLGADAPAMAAEFYRRLFAADPSARALFSNGPEVMSSKFAPELDAIVEAIISYDTFATRVRDLAARHAHYGVKTVCFATRIKAPTVALACRRVRRPRIGRSGSSGG